MERSDLPGHPSALLVASGRRFQLVREIGKGAMGVVYEAFDHERNARVAIKRLRTFEPEQLLLFKNEFRALQDIRHPNLVSLGELLQSDGQWLFTMELIDGVGFLDWVRPGGTQASNATDDDDGPTVTVPSSSRGVQSTPAPPSPRKGQARLDFERLCATLRQVAEGVCALHAGGKVHRDLKPSNIMVTADGRAVVLDFGLVTDVHAQLDTPLIMGTVAFMAPEQAACAAVGPAADWYAFGVLLYFALTGRVPFSGPNETVLQMKQQRDPTPPSALVADVPPDLDQLCTALLARDPAARPSGREVLSRLSGSVTRAAPSSSPSFVGRDRELTTLTDAVAEVARGGALTMLVHGESGQGKSALVRELIERLEQAPLASPARSLLVLAGRCYERESVAYKALDEIVDRLSRTLAELPSADAAALLSADAGLLPAIFPVLAGVPAVAAAARDQAKIDPQQQRLRSFAAMRALFERLAARFTLVTVIDDLQWADEDSLALLADLLRPPAPPPMLLIATVRTAINATRLDELQRRLSGDVRVLPILPLPPADARQLVRQLTVQASLAGNADTIADEAAGHPFFIEALVRYRLEQRDSLTPIRLDDALWWRIERLPPTPRKVLELLAVAGVPIAQEVAAKATSIDLDELDRSAATLATSKLVRTFGMRRSDAFEPYHDRVRETVLAHLSPEVQQLCHRRLAMALESIGNGDPELLGVHWRGGGDGPRAARYLVRAAGQARHALAFDRAARLYREALQLTPEEATRQSLRIKLGDALAAAGHGGDAGDAYLEAAAGAPPDEALDLRRRAAEQLMRSGRIDRGLAIFKEILAHVGLKLAPTYARAIASLLIRRARLRLRGLEPRRNGELSERERLQLDICRSTALGLTMTDPIRGSDFQARTLLLELDGGRPGPLAIALATESTHVSITGQPSRPRVARLAAQALELAQQSGDARALGYVYGGGVGAPAYLRGDFRECLDACTKSELAFTSGGCSGIAWELATVRWFRLWSLWWLGEVDELRRRVAQWTRESRAHGDMLALANFRTGHVTNAWLAADDPAEARAQAEAAMAEWSPSGYQLQHLYYFISRVQIALYEGDAAGADAIIAAEMVKVERTMQLRIEATRVTLHDLGARTALALARVDSARKSRMQRVAAGHAKQLVAIGGPHSVPLGRIVYSRLAELSGDRAAAVAHAKEAKAGFEANDMALLATLAARRLAELDGGAGIDAIDGRLSALGIAAPARIAAMLTP